MEVMHERNAHNFPLDLASVEAPSINARGGVGGAKERTEDESAGDHDRWGAGVEVE